MRPHLTKTRYHYMMALRAQWGGLTITRDMAEAICGKEHLHRIEASVADQYVRDFYPECAA